MSKTPNLLSAIDPRDLVARGYAETTMEMLAHQVSGREAAEERSARRSSDAWLGLGIK